MSSASDFLKHTVGEAASRLVNDDMLVGLGSGSTAAYFVAALAERLASGELRGVRGVPTSRATAEQATAAGIELVELAAGGLDLAVDGMDELSPTLDAIKGLGGALLREKIVAAAAARYVLIGDDSKLVDHLGQRAPIPVEVARFGWRRTHSVLSSLVTEATLRLVGGSAYETDNGNYVVDCHLKDPFEPATMAATLAAVPGVVGHGLFLGLVHEALVASANGVKRYSGSELPAGPISDAPAQS